MTEYMIDKTCREFIDALASSAPAPGGGGAVGLGGAMGAALGNMVGNLTVGKKAYAGVEDEIKELLERGLALQAQLLAAVAADAAAFEPLAAAYSLPKATPEEAEHKRSVLSAASIEACEVPLEAARTALAGLMVQKRLAEIGSKLVISDVGCGAAFLLAAVRAARLNVLINLGAILDEAYAARAKTEIAGIYTEAVRLEETIQQKVEERIGL